MCTSMDENQVSLVYTKMLKEVILGGGIMDNFYFLPCAVLNF